MTDPMDALCLPHDPLSPRTEFAAELRRRIAGELGLSPAARRDAADEAATPGRAAMTSSRATAAGVPSDPFGEQGYLVVDQVLDRGELDGIRRTVAPVFETGPYGRNDLEGFRTQRIYSLPAKFRTFDRLILDQRVLELCGAALGPTFLLTAALAINLRPDETVQPLHYDDAFYSIPRPRPPISVSTLWAIDDFTAENGATLLVPGSHRWGDTFPTEHELVTTVMPAGSVLVYPGTLVHAGGANTTDRPRLAISIQYAVGWARQQENYSLAVPRDVARKLPERLRELLGYSIQPPFMGMVDGRHPQRVLDG